MYIRHIAIEPGLHVFPLHHVKSYIIFFTVIICVVTCKSEICRDVEPHVSDRAIPCLNRLQHSGSDGFSSNYITKIAIFNIYAEVLKKEISKAGICKIIFNNERTVLFFVKFTLKFFPS